MQYALIFYGLQLILAPMGFSPPGVDMATAAERIAQGTIARRQHLGDQVLATFTSATARLHHLLSHLGPAAAIASGRVVSESDPALVTIVDEWFTGV